MAGRRAIAKAGRRHAPPGNSHDNVAASVPAFSRSMHVVGQRKMAAPQGRSALACTEKKRLHSFSGARDDALHTLRSNSERSSGGWYRTQRACRPFPGSGINTNDGQIDLWLSPRPGVLEYHASKAINSASSTPADKAKNIAPGAFVALVPLGKHASGATLAGIDRDQGPAHTRGRTQPKQGRICQKVVLRGSVPDRIPCARMLDASVSRFAVMQSSMM